MNRRAFLTHLSLLSAALADAATRLPANRNVKWALSLGLWLHLPPCPFTEILDVMKETGFLGIRITGFDGFLQHYDLTVGQLHRELSRRGLEVATISWSGPLHDPSQRAKVLDSARRAMKFLADFGASHLVVFPPPRSASRQPWQRSCRKSVPRCNQIGELAGRWASPPGLHNHMGEMVQTQEEVDRFMSMTDPKLFGLSPDTCH